MALIFMQSIIILICMKIIGTCRENCKAVALLGGDMVAARGINQRDIMVCRALRNVENAADYIMGKCAFGGPHKQWLGPMACSSEVAQNPLDYFPIEEAIRTPQEIADDQAAIGMSLPT